MAQYYYGSCPSWSFYYPYYYAPFASDFGSLAALSPHFDAGSQPVRPLELLMHVLPPSGANYLPNSWGQVMTDQRSPLHPYFPEWVSVDLNGKRVAWQGEVGRGGGGMV